MGNCCSSRDSSPKDNFAGPGRTLGSAPPRTENAKVSVPSRAAGGQQAGASATAAGGQTLGGGGGGGGDTNDARSAAARAAEVRRSRIEFPRLSQRDTNMPASLLGDSYPRRRSIFNTVFCFQKTRVRILQFPCSANIFT